MRYTLALLAGALPLIGCVPAQEATDPALLEPQLVEHPSGLVVEDLVIGDGAFCQPGDVITVEYIGRLTDGSVFASSRDAEDFQGRGAPATFALQDAMAGWREGVPGMRVGGKRRLFIPPTLAYGEIGRPPRIPPNATLVFEIELLDARRAANPAAP